MSGQRFLFFDESRESWPLILTAYSRLSCFELRNISLVVVEDQTDGATTEGVEVLKGDFDADLQIAPSEVPRKWFMMLSNCEDALDISFRCEFLNPGGFWYEQFSYDEQGFDLGRPTHVCRRAAHVLLLFARLFHPHRRLCKALVYRSQGGSLVARACSSPPSQPIRTTPSSSARWRAQPSQSSSRLCMGSGTRRMASATIRSKRFLKVAIDDALSRHSF